MYPTNTSASHFRKFDLIRSTVLSALDKMRFVVVVTKAYRIYQTRLVFFDAISNAKKDGREDKADAIGS